jgi:hypothetical protein
MPTRPAQRPLALFLCLTFAFALLIGGLASHAADEVAKDGKPAFNGKDLSGWKMKDEGGAKAWSVVGDVKLDPADPAKLVGSGQGSADKGVLLRGPIDHGSDVYTEQKFGDCELHVEFVVPKGSNSGVYLMGQYEVQVFDSYGKKEIGPGDLGSIYSVAVAKENAAKPPGEWQTLDVVFKAPRFDANGKKTENASFVLVKLNGKTIHENVDVPASTGGALPGGEQAKGPLMFQGDHGIVAFRNVRVKETAFRGGAK